MTQFDLVGVWKLSAFTIENELGPRPWRKNAHGLLIYTPGGYMSVSINSELENSDVLGSVLFYAGKYEVQGDKIIHWVCNATDPNRIGKEMIREAVQTGNEMSLIARGDFGTATLKWEKIN